MYFNYFLKVCLHTITKTLMVDGWWLYFNFSGSISEGYGKIRCIDSIHNYSTLPIRYKVDLEVEAMVVVYFYFNLFKVIVWHQERTSGPKHGRGFAGGNYYLDKLSTRIYKLFVSIPRIAPIGRTIIEKIEKSIGVPHWHEKGMLGNCHPKAHAFGMAEGLLLTIQ